MHSAQRGHLEIVRRRFDGPRYVAIPHWADELINGALGGPAARGVQLIFRSGSAGGTERNRQSGKTLMANGWACSMLRIDRKVTGAISAGQSILGINTLLR